MTPRDFWEASPRAVLVLCKVRHKAQKAAPAQMLGRAGGGRPGGEPRVRVNRIPR